MTNDASKQDDHRPAGRYRGAWLFLLAVIIVGLVADLGSKAAAFRYVADDPVEVRRDLVLQVMAQGPGRLQTLIPHHEPRVVVPSVLNFELVLNDGAVFGAGAGKRWFFIAFTVGALAFAFTYFARWTDRRDRWSHFALGLVISGGVGNLYDRIIYACVRDFIHPLPDVKLPFGLTWPQSGNDEIWPYVSNVADAFLIVGIGLLMIRLWTLDSGEKRDAKASASESDQPSSPMDEPPEDDEPASYSSVL